MSVATCRIGVKIPKTWILWLGVHYCAHEKATWPRPYADESRHIFTPYYCNHNFNIILPFNPVPPECILLMIFHNHGCICTMWFKYDRDKLWLVYTQSVPVIFEPPCISSQKILKRKAMYKVVQIWPGQTVTCLHTNSPGHIWTTLYFSLDLKL